MLSYALLGPLAVCARRHLPIVALVSMVVSMAAVLKAALIADKQSKTSGCRSLTSQAADWKVHVVSSEIPKAFDRQV